jgi:hypothetical protein
MEYVVTNATQEPMMIVHPCADLGWLEFGVWGPGAPSHPDGQIIWFCCGCFSMSWVDTLDAGESYSRQVTWHMYDLYAEEFIQQPGTYTLVGIFSAQGSLDQMLSLEIEVLPGAAELPEPLRSWGNIKALYR